MKKFYKIALIFLVIINIYFVRYNSYATGFDIWEIGDSFLDAGSEESFFSQLSKWASTNSSTSVFKGLLDFIWGLGLLVVFISTFIIGIKYMLVLPNEKSRIKQATTPYIIGVVIIFGAVTIWKFVIDILDGSMIGR